MIFMHKKDLVTIGFLGFGTVGSGALKILQEHQNEIRSRLGCPLRVKAICSPSIDKRYTDWVDPQIVKTTDAQSIITDPEIDIVVEAMGGIEPARAYILSALAQGKSVVTANKLLLATAGAELARAAAEAGRTLGIEASVCGGIPVLNAIREGLAGERFQSIHGILNGTTNYILTEMEKTGRPFNEILSAAQKLGYAEADPTLDIEGLDARDKLTILAMLCFGSVIDKEKVPTTGITRLQPVDFVYAHHLGYTIRLICTARRIADGLAISVGPTLVPRTSILAKVDGSFNALLLTGEAGGRTMYYGRGAGGGPTGIAIVSDIIRIARELFLGVANLAPPFSALTLAAMRPAPVSSFVFPYALRFVVLDRPGIIASIAAVLARHQINIDAVLQEKVYEDKQRLPFVVTLEPAAEDKVNQALAEMAGFDFLAEPPLALRIEAID